MVILSLTGQADNPEVTPHLVDIYPPDFLAKMISHAERMKEVGSEIERGSRPAGDRFKL